MILNPPRLSFLPPEPEPGMMVDEINFGHEHGQPMAPFRGSRFVVYPGQTSPLDVHEVTECWFVASGTGVVTYNAHHTEPIKPGDVLYFPSRQSHDVHNNGTENLLIFSVWWTA